jgi:SHS2 domain-containing protein
MAVRRVEHTGELELRLSHRTRAGVYREAVRGLAEELGRPGAGPCEERGVAIDSSGPDALLADLLNEVLYLAEVDGFIAQDLLVDEVADGRLAGRLVGGPGAVRALVKAATYHGLRVWRDGGRWNASVVLDV